MLLIYEMRDGNVTTDDENSQVLHFEERGLHKWHKTVRRSERDKVNVKC